MIYELLEFNMPLFLIFNVFCFGSLSFVTDPSSVGLNVALNSTCEKSESKDTRGGSMQNCDDTFGISGAVVIAGLQSCSLKALKYSDDSYLASLSPV